MMDPAIIMISFSLQPVAGLSRNIILGSFLHPWMPFVQGQEVCVKAHVDDFVD